MLRMHRKMRAICIFACLVVASLSEKTVSAVETFSLMNIYAKYDTGDFKFKAIYCFILTCAINLR